MIETVSDQDFFKSIQTELQLYRTTVVYTCLLTKYIDLIQKTDYKRKLFIIRETLNNWEKFESVPDRCSVFLQQIYVEIYKSKPTENQQDLLAKISKKIYNALNKGEFGVSRSSRYNYKVDLNLRFVKYFKFNQQKLIEKYLSFSEKMEIGIFGKGRQQCFAAMLLKLIIQSASNEEVVSLFNSRYHKNNFCHVECNIYTKYFIQHKNLDQLKILVTLILTGGGDGCNAYRYHSYKTLIASLSDCELKSFTLDRWNSKSFISKCKFEYLKYAKSKSAQKLSGIKRELISITNKENTNLIKQIQEFV